MSETSTRRLEDVPLDEFVPAQRNPKRHADAELARSIERFGYVEPVVVDERTGRLVSGHGRVERLRTLRDAGAAPPEGVAVREDGTWAVPTVRGWSSRDDAEAEAFLVAVNRIGEVGGWNEGSLLELLETLKAGPGLLGTGFTESSVEVLLKKIRPEVPDEFGLLDPGVLPTQFSCPSCGYRWSGNPNPGGADPG